MSCNMVLPKLWLQYIQRYWDRKVPEDYPKDTGVKFSTYFESKEVQDAVNEMEKNLADEEKSILVTSKEEEQKVIKEGQAIDEYIGTYDVSGTPGESVLLSPEKVDDSVVGAVAFHFVKADDTAEEPKKEDKWEVVKDVTVKDGYVYGKLESFSPVAVFTLRRSAYCCKDTESENKLWNDRKVFVCNGVPCTIKAKDGDNSDGKRIVIDDLGNETEIEKKTVIIGGTIDGTDVESTNLTFIGCNPEKVIGGSVSKSKHVTVKSVTINVKDCGDPTKDATTVSSSQDPKSIVNGTGYNCTVDKFVINVDNSALYNIGAGDIIIDSYTPRDSNNIYTDDKEGKVYDHLDLTSPAKVKDVLMNVSNSYIEVLFMATNNGYGYTNYTEAHIKDSKIKALICAGSNGVTNSAYVEAENCEIEEVTHNNRGVDKYAKSKFTNCKIDKFYIGCSPETTPSTTRTGSIESVETELIGGSATLHLWQVENAMVTKEQAEATIKGITVSSTTDLKYCSEKEPSEECCKCTAEEILKPIVEKFNK